MTDQVTEVFDFRKPDAESDHAALKLVQPVFFVGFMGAGKTSVARKLARRAGTAAVDLDAYIERIAGMRIAEIFEEMGEEGFRDLETQTLAEFVGGEPVLVSCGGGIVLREENRELLKSGGYVVYLQVTAAEAASRISNLASRPLFGDVERAQAVIDSRLPLYEEVADMTIDTAGRGSGAIAREALFLLKKEGVLTQREGC